MTVADSLHDESDVDENGRDDDSAAGSHGRAGDDVPQGRRRLGSSMLPQRFALHRLHDISGISGEGVVAFGTVYATGLTTLAWCAGDITSVSVFDSPEHVVRVHGRDGSTRLVWIDRPGRHQLVEGVE